MSGVAFSVVALDRFEHPVRLPFRYDSLASMRDVALSF
jgi:hypothetical protein